MKKGIIIPFLCSVVLAFSVNLTVCADTAFSDSSYYISYATNQVTVSARTPYPSTRVTLIVLNPGKMLSDVQYDSFALQYQRELLSNGEGVFSITFPINDNAADLTTDEVFSVYAKVPGYEIEKIMDIKYKSQDTRFKLLEELKKGVPEIHEIFNSEENCNALSINDLIAFKSIDKSKLSSLVSGNFGRFQQDENGYDAACKYLREFCVLELFNEKKIEMVYDSGGTYLQETAFSFSEYDKKNDTTLYECFLNEISNGAKKTDSSIPFWTKHKNPGEII
jgi:hypothetical protein